MDTQETERFTADRFTVTLTKEEINKLKKMVIGHGNFKQTAKLIPFHKNTLRNVIDRGRGEHRVIETIRQTLLK